MPEELANYAENALVAGNIGRFEIRAASDYFQLLQMICQAGRKKFDDMDGMGYNGGGILGYARPYSRDTCSISGFPPLKQFEGNRPRQWRVIMPVIFMTEDQLDKLVRKAIREELKASSYAFWASCVTNDIDADDLMRVVKRDRDKLEEYDRKFSASVKPHAAPE